MFPQVDFSNNPTVLLLKRRFLLVNSQAPCTVTANLL